jgi:hypothetical protein
MGFHEFYMPIEDFPDYGITPLGEVFNLRRKTEMAHSLNYSGEHTVGLTRDGRQYRRSVKVLVARQFVEGETDIFDTPILLDGDRANLKPENIVWRPRWFALMYQRQFDEFEDWWWVGPVVDDTHGAVYPSIFDAAIMTGCLVKDIRTGMMNRTRVFPTGSKFYFG